MNTAIRFLFFCVYWTQHAQIKSTGPIEDHREAAWFAIVFMSAPLTAMVLIVDITLFSFIFGKPVLISLNAWLGVIPLMILSVVVHYVVFVRDDHYVSIYREFSRLRLGRLATRSVALFYIVVPNLVLLALIAWQKS